MDQRQITVIAFGIALLLIVLSWLLHGPGISPTASAPPGPTQPKP
jgi:hypothetical protein